MKRFSLMKEQPCFVRWVGTRRDINPVAPTHVLVVPKRRNGLTQLRYATADHSGVLGHMLEVAAKIANQEELDGCRSVSRIACDWAPL